MRSSSIKSLVATATLIATVTLAAAPAAQAAPTAGERAQRTVTRLLQRIVRIATLGLPGDPIPVSSPLTDTTTLTTTLPKKQR